MSSNISNLIFYVLIFFTDSSHNSIELRLFFSKSSKWNNVEVTQLSKEVYLWGERFVVVKLVGVIDRLVVTLL